MPIRGSRVCLACALPDMGLCPVASLSSTKEKNHILQEIPSFPETAYQERECARYLRVSCSDFMIV
jgi:hypothetical protein